MEEAPIAWHEIQSKSKRHMGKIYYHNIYTKESVWERPKGVPIKPLMESQKFLAAMNREEESPGSSESRSTCVLKQNKTEENHGPSEEEGDDLEDFFKILKNNPKEKESKTKNEEKVGDKMSFSSASSGSSKLKISWRPHCKTPIEDVNDQQKQQILKNQDNSDGITLYKNPGTSMKKNSTSPNKTPSFFNSTDNLSFLSKSSSGSSPSLKRNWSQVYKTPIQDQYEQKRQRLLENQKIKATETAGNEESKVKRKPVHERIGFLNPDDSTSRDLRSKLNSRKDPNSAAVEEFEMDWESAGMNENEPQQNTLFSGVEKTCSSPKGIPENLKRIYLVADTSSLCKDTNLVDNLINTGKFPRMLPEVVLVIPYIVFTELDTVKTKETVGHEARKIIRIIANAQALSTEGLTKKYFLLQDGSKSREACCSLKIEINDDMVLNCCLQQRDKCMEDEIAILITEDNNLANKASSFKLLTHKWASFRRWARSQVYMEDNQKNSIKSIPATTKSKISDEMEVDVTREVRSTSTDHIVIGSLKQKSQSDEHCRPLDHSLQNCARTCSEEVKMEFQTYITGVIDEALENEYGDLKKFTTTPKLGWTIFDCITNLRNKWALIMDTNPTDDHLSLLKRMVELFKKTNMHRSKSVSLTAADMANLFSFGKTLCEILSKKYKQKTENFHRKLICMEKDWKDELLNLRLSPEENVDAKNISGEDSCDAVDVAVQNTFSRFKSEFVNLKGLKSSSKNVDWLTLYTEAGNLWAALYNVRLDSSEYGIFIKLLEKYGFPDISHENVKDYLLENPQRLLTTIADVMEFVRMCDSQIE